MTRLAGLWPFRYAGGLRGFSTGHPALAKNWPASVRATLRAFLHPPAAVIRGPKSQEPRAKSQEPKAKNQKPKAKSQKPRTKSQKPRAKSQEPRAKSQEPRAKAKTKDPRAK